LKARPVPNPLASATFRVKLRGRSQGDEIRPPEKPTARVPRVARLLALAHRIDEMIRSGELNNWAEAARSLGISRARVTQIANLLLLSPSLQETILDHTGQNPINEYPLRSTTAKAIWHEQLLVR